MDWEAFVADVWESVNDSLYTEQAGDLAAGDPIVATIGETWQGALYGTEENNYGQRAVYLFQTEDEQRSWFDAVTSDMR